MADNAYKEERPDLFRPYNMYMCLEKLFTNFNIFAVYILPLFTFYPAPL